MNPVIRIDDDAFAILQSVAKPLVHSASDAIRVLCRWSFCGGGRQTARGNGRFTGSHSGVCP
jgi:hypothetical protein